MYSKPTKICYPNTHPDLHNIQQPLRNASVAAMAVSSRDAIIPTSTPTASSSTLGVRKSPPATISAETTHVVKSVKVAMGGSRGHTRTSDFDELTKAVLKDAITVYKGHLFTNGAFLECSEEYDLAVESFIFMCKTHKIQMEIDNDLMKLITQCSSQARGDCKSKAHPLVPPAFGINLLNRANFLYKDPATRSGLYQNTIIQTVLNAIWFKNKNDEEAMNPNFLKDGIPLPAIALVFTVIECCIDEWQTGQHVDVQFTALHQSLAKRARKHAKMVDKPTAHAAQIDDVDLESAKKDWEDFNDSDEDKEANEDEEQLTVGQA
ncbi:hypothetical protein ARMGADRAFT_1025917 [Armillaria gallica]|uniref:DUF6532 domain-containing protein n=1 Tax=Armillaria gallica TaxID=47427 RepID=A0A2H3DX37_ARMGA|nr:hypothetical protein ARMGADRAFT_1025917 [Armillaria gallica]